MRGLLRHALSRNQGAAAITIQNHTNPAAARAARISSSSDRSTLSSRRTARKDFDPACLKLPFFAALALPSAVFGPVEKRHGMFTFAALRSRRIPAAEKPFHFARFRLPAATRRGLGAASVARVGDGRALPPSSVRVFRFSRLGFFRMRFMLIVVRGGCRPFPLGSLFLAVGGDRLKHLAKLAPQLRRGV